MHKRRQILIDRTFQHRLAIDLMVFVLIVPAVLWADFYILSQYALAKNADVTNVGSGWGLIGTLIKQQWLFMLLLFLFNFALVYAFVLFYTHRIAGPMYRFSRTIDDMTEGRLAQKVQLRKKDYFENLGASINRMSERLCAQLSELKTVAAALSARAQASNDRELKERVTALEETLARFELSLPEQAHGAADEMSSSTSTGDGDVRTEP